MADKMHAAHAARNATSQAKRDTIVGLFEPHERVARHPGECGKGHSQRDIGKIVKLPQTSIGWHLREAGHRQRTVRTRSEMGDFKTQLFRLVLTSRPATVRHIYYQAVSKGVVGKGDKGIRDVTNALGAMREDGQLPWEWIVDTTRSCVRPGTFGSPREAMVELCDTYRRDPWADQPKLVVVWCESDSVAGTLQPTTMDLNFRTPLWSARGQSSKILIHDCAEELAGCGKPVEIIYCGDLDPSGRAIAGSVADRTERYGGDDVDFEFHRLAITFDQVKASAELQGAGHSCNTRDPNFRKYISASREAFGSGSPLIGQAFEIEAMSPVELRQLVADAIEPHIDRTLWDESLEIEEDERRMLRRGLPWVSP